MKDVAFTLEFIVDLLGIGGAGLAMMPVLGDVGRKRLRAVLGGPASIGPFARLLPKARAVANADVERFRPGDDHCFRISLTMIASSYGLHMVTLVLHRMAH